MKYPFSPEILDALPERVAELYRELELELLEGICKRLDISGQLNEVAIQNIRALRSHGITLNEIKRAISKKSRMAEKELNKLFNDVVRRNEQYYGEQFSAAKVTQPERLVDENDIDRIRRQTKDEFSNITQSMGFLIRQGGKLVQLPPAKAYQWALDKAVLQIESGAINYNDAIRGAIKQLADSGLKTVNYESGHTDHIDVAIRRAIMTGVAQISDKYTEQSAERLRTNRFEVSAHRGARDTGYGPMNHKSWQGKVYSTAESDIYPNIYEVCGLGTGEGLEGWNCRHRRFPWIEGVSERTYTDEQLENIDPPPFEYEGQTYTAYEATQKQRMIERTIRSLERRRTAQKAAGLEEDATATGAKIRRLKAKYKEFSKAAQLPEQPERARVYTPANKKTTNVPQKVATPRTNGIIKEKTSGESTVQTIAKIDIKKYEAVSKDIRTDEVVITNERIQHIKESHPNDFEKYSSYIRDMVERPQYILKDNVPNTAVILKEFNGEGGERFRLILKLAVTEDEEFKKNSVITFLKISEKKFKKYLRNKKILYKSE